MKEHIMISIPDEAFCTLLENYLMKTLKFKFSGVGGGSTEFEKKTDKLPEIATKIHENFGKKVSAAIHVMKIKNDDIAWEGSLKPLIKKQPKRLVVEVSDEEIEGFKLDLLNDDPEEIKKFTKAEIIEMASQINITVKEI